MRELFRQAAQTNSGRASLFNLHPTLLQVMGYRPEDLARGNDFEPTLFQALPDENQRFLSDFFVRFGQKPVWNDTRSD